MNQFSKPLGIAFLSLFSCSVLAVDIPDVDIGAQQLNQATCVDEAAQTCINDACLNSEAIDCEDNCQKLAQDKCQQQQDE